MMVLTLWGQGHLWWVKEKRDLFGLVCGGVLALLLASALRGKNLSDEAGIWQS